MSNTLDTTALEARIQRLEDVAAITQLTATYAHHIDKGWTGNPVANHDRFPSVFSSDATWRSAAMGVDVTGPAAIAEALDEAAASTDFAMHSFTNPVIVVEGDTARATWLLWVAVNTGGAANEVFQSEDIGYRRTADGWRIQSIYLHFGQLLNS